jgi:hypothetical protein
MSITSQLPTGQWHEQLSEPTLAEPWPCAATGKMPTGANLCGLFLTGPPAWYRMGT